MSLTKNSSVTEKVPSEISSDATIVPQHQTNSGQPNRDIEPNTSKKTTHSCGLCENKNTRWMVLCDNCEVWYHFSCAKVKQAELEKVDEWFCQKCTKSSTNTNDNGNTNLVEQTPKALSETSTARKRNAEIRLSKLDEEMELRKKQMELRKKQMEDHRQIEEKLEALRLDQEYLKRRQEIESECSSRSSRSDGSVDNNSSTAKWVENHKENYFKNHYEEVPSAVVTDDLFFRQPRVNIPQPNVQDNRPESQPVISRPRAVQFQNPPTVVHKTQQQIISYDLPKFDGNPLDWPTFYANFVSSTRACGFTNEQNARRLQKCLSGEAHKRVWALLALPDTIPDAINTLKMSYGNPMSIINAAMSEIRAHPFIRTEDFQKLIDFASMVNNMCQIIQMSGMSTYLHNPMLIEEMLGKLSTDLNMEFIKHCVNEHDETSIKVFCEWISKYSVNASKLFQLKQSKSLKPCVFESNRSTNANRFPNSNRAQTTNRAVSSNRATNPNRTKPTETKAFGHFVHTKEDVVQNSNCPTPNCVVCKEQNHPLTECEQFKGFSRNKRWDTVLENRMCSRCLQPHDIRRCKLENKCGVDGCEYRHHPLLHSAKQSVSSMKKTGPGNQHVVATTQAGTASVLYRVIPVIIHGPHSAVRTYAFLDEGSSITLVETSLLDHVGLRGPERNLCLRWTDDQTRVEEKSMVVDITISGLQSGSKFKLRDVHSVKSLSLPVQTVRGEELKREYPHLNDIPIESYTDAVPRILIGLDNWNVGVPREVCEGKPWQPIAIKARIGWSISGPIDNRDVTKQHVAHHMHICGCDDEKLHQMVKDFFSLENFGVKVPEITLESKEDTHAKMLMETTTKRIGKRYETGLLWKSSDVVLPKSFEMAMKRLLYLESKMQKDDVLAEKLRKEITDFVSKGYATKLLPEEQVEDSRTWYLPMFTVKNPNKPLKFRVVWDAAAKSNNTSLNDNLLKGPDELQSLVEILYRFREHRFAFTGDIKEMFQQVVIRPADRNAQRFLWREGDVTRAPDIYVMNVMTFGAKCSPASAQHVKNLNASEYASQYPKAAAVIKANHYVDDWLQSCETVEEAVTLINEVKMIHAEAGFEIRNWICNSAEVLSQIDSNQQTESRTLPFENDSEKVLGLWWCTKSDCFKFKINYTKIDENFFNASRIPTKREVLRILMSIYDPLGLISVFLVHVKVLLQDVWRSGIAWDNQLLQPEWEKWKQWVHLLSQLHNIRVPRWYSVTSQTENIQLHIFVDASETVYAAVAYLRVENIHGVDVTLIGSKTKVAPLRGLSIPRMELQAAILGVRLKSTILKCHSLRIDSCNMWTDSETVVRWIRSDQRKYKQFVSIRIGELLEGSNIDEWLWIRSKLNVADDATKWKSLDFSSNDRWFAGPDFLKMSKDVWPIDALKNPTPPNEDLRSTEATVTVIIKSDQASPQFAKFSSWNRLRRSQAYVIRYTRNLYAKAKKLPGQSGPLKKDEIEAAERVIFRTIQKSVFKEEINALNHNPPTKLPYSSNIRRLSPFLDEEGVLRHKSRLCPNYEVVFGYGSPIILPRHHQVTDLILLFYHKLYHHKNHETVVNEIRKIYVISNLRTALNTVRRKCQTCKNALARPTVPEMAPLPPARLGGGSGERVAPFSYTGIDYFGPMDIIDGRTTKKRYGVIFTCLTIRAVHIELAESLSTSSCIMAIENFIARRGTPLEIFSDNGTNFKGTLNEFQRIAQYEDSFQGIKWSFNPPASPHMGGVWERLVRSIKESMKVALPIKVTNEEILRNTLTQIENVINSRPLTYIPIDPDEVEAITPNHFLLGSSNGMKPLGKCTNDVLYLRNSYKISQHMLDVFWQKFVKEFIPHISRRSKWFDNVGVREVEINDVVVIYDPEVRNSWKRGIILDVNKGRDDKVRSVVVKTSSGIYTRPVAKIAVLDVRTTETKVNNDHAAVVVYEGEDVAEQRLASHPNKN